MPPDITGSLSVVIPAFNAAPFIRDTLASLDRQSVRPREVIVVDDGSTDGTGAIASSFIFSDGTVPTVIRHENSLGVATARNHGVFAARGDWVGLCDSDDLWHRDRVKAVVTLASQRPEALAIATDMSGFALDKDRNELENRQRGAMVNDWIPEAAILSLIDRQLSSSGIDEITLSDLQQDIVFGTTSVCYRRDAYALAGGCATWSDLSDDFMLNVSMTQFAPIARIKTPYVFYRVRPQSLSHADTNITTGYLAANVAARYGVRDRDHRMAGALYCHLLLAAARNNSIPFATLLGFSLLGRLAPTDLTRLTRAYIKGRFRSLVRHDKRRYEVSR